MAYAPHHDADDTASEFSDVSAATTTQSSAQHLFTCLACHVAFRLADHQRDHMRTDWHRYNLKRKVAELPPVSLEEFSERVKAMQQQGANAAGKNEAGRKRKEEWSCAACGKTYSSDNAYNAHIASKKHKDQQAKFDSKAPSQTSKSAKSAAPIVSSAQIAKEGSLESGEQGGGGSSSSAPPVEAKTWKQQLAQAQSESEVMAILAKKEETAVRLEEEDCLFCSFRSESFEKNLEHMAKSHSFFIPDIEYLVDSRGLIKYLGEKITVQNLCLYCNGKGRAMHTLEAVRKHMLDKGHCKILYEDGAELEIADFYDFSSTYPDEATVPTSDVDGEEGDWEDVDGDDEEELPSGNSSITINSTQTQLTLPSGARIGHRAYRHIWNQNLPSTRVNTHDSVLINRIASQYLALGYERTPWEVAKQHHERRLQAAKKERNRTEFLGIVGQKQNKLQKHFRSQIGFGV